MHFCLVQSDAMTFGTTTLRIMAFGIMTLSTMVVIVRVSLLDKKNIVLISVTFFFVNLSVIMLSVYGVCHDAQCDYAEYIYAECHFALCHYAESLC
jgi:hypothetical protein